jgi:ribulose kinase
MVKYLARLKTGPMMSLVPLALVAVMRQLEQKKQRVMQAQIFLIQLPSFINFKIGQRSSNRSLLFYVFKKVFRKL